ncbi:MAG: GntR family transcriptional regulator [Desulfovibrionaceae bacterium]|nr:GntR family transcriptional regulator [Desulfovibrionaceae bacterium]
MPLRALSKSPIKRNDVFQEVLRRLDTLASDSSYKPGDRLPPERELADRLGVSRTLVRQALKLLEAAGKVTSRIGSGTYIAEPGTMRQANLISFTVPQVVTREYMFKLIELRSIIEQEIFGIFCRRHTEKQIEELVTLLEEERRDTSSDDEMIGLDLSFEERVGIFIDHEPLYCVQKQLHQAWIMAWTRYGYFPDDKEVLHEEHFGLLKALLRGDCDDVTARVRAHVERAYYTPSFNPDRPDQPRRPVKPAAK